MPPTPPQATIKAETSKDWAGTSLLLGVDSPMHTAAAQGKNPLTEQQVLAKGSQNLSLHGTSAIY